MAKSGPGPSKKTRRVDPVEEGPKKSAKRAAVPNGAGQEGDASAKSAKSAKTSAKAGQPVAESARGKSGKRAAAGNGRAAEPPPAPTSAQSARTKSGKRAGSREEEPPPIEKKSSGKSSKKKAVANANADGRDDDDRDPRPRRKSGAKQAANVLGSPPVLIGIGVAIIALVAVVLWLAMKPAAPPQKKEHGIGDYAAKEKEALKLFEEAKALRDEGEKTWKGGDQGAEKLKESYSKLIDAMNVCNEVFEDAQKHKRESAVGKLRDEYGKMATFRQNLKAHAGVVWPDKHLKETTGGGEEDDWWNRTSAAPKK
ncbi:MAG: hypothetical protein HY719_08160 [Planctomycetes bacterium]|nr:hypothetical protein [Planctomycetota bacterium]